MPLADYDAYVAALRENLAIDFQTGSATGRSARLSAAYRASLPAPSTPTASVALGRTSDVAMGPMPIVGAGRLSLLGARSNPGGTSGAALILVDLLNQSGGLDGTLASAQTTGLPTAALTRYTSGEGVMVGLVVYSQIGTTATTVTISYTNQAGTPGRTSTATAFGGSGFREAAICIPIPLAAGDTGVRSVESVTVAATTGTIGNFGVVLFKPLAMLALNDFSGAHVVDAVSSGGFIGALAEVHPEACIVPLTVANSVQPYAGAVIVGEV